MVVTGLSPRRMAFHSRSVHVRFVTNKVAVGQVFLGVLRFSPVSTMPPMLHTGPHLHVVLTSRANGRSLKTTQKTMLFGNRGAPDRKGISSFFPAFKALR
jgi:hypothetical protein